MLHNALVLLLFIGTAQARKKESGLRIYYGDDTEPGEFPFMVSLLDQTGDHYCGGALINPMVVVTAAHCVVWDGIQTDPYRVIARFGAWNLTEESASEESVPVARIIPHPDYNEYTIENDIAVIILKEEVDINAKVSPISLPEDDSVYAEGTPITVLGWGGTETDWQSDVLQKHEYAISDQEACNETWSSAGYPVWEGMVCTGEPPLDGHAWFGDSGGPLVAKVGGEFVLVALTSWGSEEASNYTYDVSTDVLYYLDWIMANGNSSKSMSLKLMGGDGASHGVVVVDTFSQYGTICSDSIGPNEVRAICHHFGFEDGIAGHISDYGASNKKGKGMGDEFPGFAVSKMECPPNAENITEDCTFESYPDQVPCFDGDQLAVRCSNESWTFNITHFDSRVVSTSKGVSKGKVFCSVEAHKYNVTLDVSQSTSAYLLDWVDGSMEYIKEMTYKNKMGGFMAKVKPKDNVQHTCLVCYVEVKGSPAFFVMETDDTCAGAFGGKSVRYTRRKKN